MANPVRYTAPYGHLTQPSTPTLHFYGKSDTISRQTLRVRPHRPHPHDGEPLLLSALDRPTGSNRCRLSGRNLFVVAAIGDTADMARAVTVPAGFVATSIRLPRPAGDALFLRLHDAPDSVVRVTVPMRG